MAEGSVDTEIDAAPDAVWAIIGDFGGIADFFPGIESCRLEGDDRVIAMLGMEIRERLLKKDDAARSLTYSIVGGLPLESHEATVAISPQGEGSSVTWSFSCKPDEMAPLFEDTYRGALKELALKF